MFDSIEEVQRAMERDRYICDRGLATVLYLALKLEKPVLIEGGADVGKTEVAKVMAQILAYTGAT
jgi:MoxR-like ATPase